MNTTIFNNSQQLLMVDEATLRTILKEIVGEALSEAQRAAQTPVMLTRAEAMDALHIKPTSLWQLQQSGKLHPQRIGGKVLYTKDEVDALLTRKGAR